MEVSATPHVTVEACEGSLTVRGEGDREIRLMVKAKEDEVRLEREGEKVTLTIPDDGTLVCPHGTVLTVERAKGNLYVEGITGSLTLATAHGNVTLEDVGTVASDKTLGNLRARGVAGDLIGQDVKGNARVREVQGQLLLHEVAGNLVVEELEGGLQAQKVRGNVRLGPPFAPGSTYRADASGNLTLLLPPDADVKLVLRTAGRVRSTLPGLSLETVGDETRGTLRAGASLVEANARGNLTLRPLEPGEALEGEAGLEQLGAQIEWQVSEAMAALTTRLESSLGRLDPEPIQRKVQEATEQARRKAEQAAERARMRAERAERRWRRASGERPRSRPEPASDEERLRVLRMVEEGRLTPEQASKLLAALDGE
jgi:hypothetical protein